MKSWIQDALAPSLEHQIASAKKTARLHYLAHDELRDRYDCGLAMAMVMNPAIDEHASEFNKAMEVLERLDPACPKGKRLQRATA